MATLHVWLEEGFNGESVRLRLGDREFYSKEQVKTRNQIGLADTADIEVPDGTAEIRVEVPSRSATKSIPVSISGDTYLGITLTPDGKIDDRISDRPFRKA
jgi:hypothetical protein